MKHLIIFLAVLTGLFIAPAQLSAQCDPPPFVNAGADITLECFNQWDTLVGTAEAGATFLWTGPNGYQSTGAEAYVETPGTYTLTITALNGCTAQDQVVVALNGTPADVTVEAVQNVSCFNGNNGAITVGSSDPNAVFLWSNGVVGPVAANLTAGFYCVTVTNTSGCFASECVAVTQPANGVIANVNAGQPTSCTGLGSAVAFATGGTSPYDFAWSGPNGFTAFQENQFQVQLTNLEFGAYIVTVTDANGCTSISLDSVNAPLPLDLSSYTTCQDGIFPLVNGGAPPFTFLWSTGSTTAALTGIQPGTYFLTVTDAFGCTAEQSFTLEVNAPSCTQIRGRIGSDENNDCDATIDDPALANIFVTAEGGGLIYYGVTDVNGNYFINVPPGIYTVKAVVPAAASCPNVIQVTLNNVGEVIEADFAIQGINLTCPLLTVDIGTPFLRRCFQSAYYIQYCNNSLVGATDATMVVTLDPFLTPVSASLPYTDLGNGQLEFELGDVDPLECNTINLNVMVSCNAVLGQAHCTEVHIYPDTLCDNSYTGAIVDLRADCEGDSLHFILTNVGDETMSESLKYIVIEDGIMTYENMSNPLAPTESMTVSLPGNGSTWRLEAEQEAAYPGEELPVLSVEGCTTDSLFSTGFAGQFSVNDNPPYLDIDCTTNQGSYDPNDKQGFPVGYGSEHYIKPRTEIEYMIRFQNTGTDTAFHVAIRDTLSAWFDITSIETGASSHHYTWSVTGNNILLFDFPNILLPDSNVNQAGSQGFIRFRIRPKDNTPLETDLFNSAAIYFDFNEPVITNTTQHRIGLNFVSVSAWQPVRMQYDVTIAPHPLQNVSWLTVNNAPESGDYRLRVYDAQGKMVTAKQSDQARFELLRFDMRPGMYFFEIILDGTHVGSGKLMVH